MVICSDHIFVRLVLESLRKDAGDGNEDDKKAILGLQPRDKAAMLGVNTTEILLEKLTWK